MTASSPEQQNFSWLRFARAAGLAAVVAASLLACGGDEPTRVLLEVHYDARWELSRLQLDMDGTATSVAPVRKLELRVSDELAGEPLELRLAGFAGEQLVAAGGTTVTPKLGEAVSAAVTLYCGDGCTPGDTRCSGDGVQSCESQATDACTAWSTPVECPAATPYCAQGQCADNCADECTAGTSQCAGPAAQQQCGEHDSDSCTDWGPAVECAPDQSCTMGSCATSCDECPYQGAVDCVGEAVITCGDRDGDSCLEWSAPEPCDTGTTCLGGSCTAQNIVTVALAGPGTGRVTSEPAGIACPGDCQEAFSSGTPVTLTAAANAGNVFAGWSGAGCSGTGTCEVTAGNTLVATARFELLPQTLTVSQTGSGSGTVASNPSGIYCGDTCSAQFPAGTQVVLTAMPEFGSAFTRWSGGSCSGAGSCTVTVNEATTITATFTAKQPVDVRLTHSNSMNIELGNSFGCTDNPQDPYNSTYHFDNSFYRVFKPADFNITGRFAVTSVQVGIEMAEAGTGTSQPVEVRLHTLVGNISTGTLTLLDRYPLVVDDSSRVTMEVTTSTEVPADATLVVEFVMPSGESNNNMLWVGVNTDGESDPTYLKAPACGLTEITSNAELGAGDLNWVLAVDARYYQ